MGRNKINKGYWFGPNGEGKEHIIISHPKYTLDMLRYIVFDDEMIIKKLNEALYGSRLQSMLTSMLRDIRKLDKGILTLNEEDIIFMLDVLDGSKTIDFMNFK